ncbi:MAG TPA: hypothetical protein VNX68_17055 [Nitrosopumilaceae archaeon]|jgi:hypothetical protein|nr:hypothetical protein [Nitrosopumilaceae archaeon]
MTKVKIIVYNNKAGGFPDPPDKLLEYIKWLQSIVAQIPAEYRDNAVCDLEADTQYGLGILVIEIYYHRPETASETGERLAKEERRQIDIKQSELAELHRLQQKYPD